jgi:hypothetical protein
VANRVSEKQPWPILADLAKVMQDAVNGVPIRDNRLSVDHSNEVQKLQAELALKAKSLHDLSLKFNFLKSQVKSAASTHPKIGKLFLKKSKKR